MINNYFMFVRLYHRSVAYLGSVSFHNGLTLDSRYKIIIKNNKSSTKKKFVVWKGMQVSDLVKSLNMKGEDVIEVLNRVLKYEVKLSYSMVIHDIPLLSKVAKLCGGSIEEKKVEKVVDIVDKNVYRRNIFLNPERLKSRPPVVTIMGHVDHGKTTLLDNLRSSRIVDSEFGGITQHIGAFKVKLSDISGKESVNYTNEIVTFLDTPGHAAFSSMRSRGAHCTDIVILVVAIDDGLMPQTLESIRFAKEAKVPIIVVINKVDCICSNVDQIDNNASNKRFEAIYKSLSKHGIVVEQYGGEVQCIPISALKKWNLDLLQESILALSELIDIRCDYEGPCEGVVLEAKTSEHLGKVATVLVQQGCVKVGAILISGNTFSKVRTIRSDSGKFLTDAKPGDPVEITGWKDLLPEAGDVVIEVKNELRAKEVLHYRKSIIDKIKSEKDFKGYEKAMEMYKKSYKAYVEDGFQKGFRLRLERPELKDFLEGPKMVNGVEIPRINLIIKADVQGSLEAIEDVLQLAMESCMDQCDIKIAHLGIGGLSENDIERASFTNSVIYLFNLPQSLSAYRSMQVDVRHFNVIYHMFDDLKDYIASKLPPISQCEVVGEAEALQMFTIREKKGKVPVIGAKCFNGILYRSKEEYYYRVMRRYNEDLVIIKDGIVCKSLRHLKEDIESVRRGVECGIILVDNNGEPEQVNRGEIVQCCKTVYLKQKLNWNLGFE